MSLSERNNSDSEYSQLIHELQEFQANKQELVQNLQDIEHQILYREQQLMLTSRKFGNIATGLKLQAFLPDVDGSNSNSLGGGSLFMDSKKLCRQRSNSSLETLDDSSHFVSSPNAQVASEDEYIFSMSSMTSPIYDNNTQTMDHCHEICNQDELSGSEQTSNVSCPKSSPQCIPVNRNVQWQDQGCNVPQDMSDVCNNNPSSSNIIYDPSYSRSHSACSVISHDSTRNQKSVHCQQLNLDRNPVTKIYSHEVNQSPGAHVSHNYKNQTANRYHSHSGYQNS